MLVTGCTVHYWPRRRSIMIEWSHRRSIVWWGRRWVAVRWLNRWTIFVAWRTVAWSSGWWAIAWSAAWWAVTWSTATVRRQVTGRNGVIVGIIITPSLNMRKITNKFEIDAKILNTFSVEETNDSTNLHRDSFATHPNMNPADPISFSPLQ